MNREIENRFFRMFGTNGVAVLGMEYITYKHGFKSLPDDMKDFYMKSIPDIVQERTEAFDDSMFMGIDGERPTIMTEIENNLDECTDENKRERYVFDLLTPFAAWSAYFRPLAEHPFAERHEACECDRYIEILGKAEQGTTEWYCKLWYRLVLYYADMLHSIFLRYGIDFYKVQKDCDVYLKDENFDVLPYGFFDSPKLAQYYADKQPKQEPNDSLNEKQSKSVRLPEILNTERVRKIFDCATSKGWMYPNGKGGYEWVGIIGVGKWQQLAYMCGEIFGYRKLEYGNAGASIPSKELEKLFGVTRLYDKLAKCWDANIKQKWRAAIDEMIKKATESTPI